MELVCASTTSIFKLCAFPSGAGRGSGASTAPSKASSSDSGPSPVVLSSWRPSPGSLDTRQLGEVEKIISIDDSNLISAHKFASGTGSLIFHHSLKLDLSKDDDESDQHKDKEQPKTKDDKKNKESSAQKPPKIIAQCRPLLALRQTEFQTASLQVIPNSKKFIHVASNGTVSVCSFEDGLDHLRQPLTLVEEPEPSSKNSKKASKNKSSSQKSDSEPAPQEEPKKTVYQLPDGMIQFHLGSEACSSRINPFKPHLLAVVGPQGQTLVVADLEQQVPVWKAKNVKHDILKMEVPIWDMDCDWIDEDHVATCTAYSQIRVYNVTSGKRQPVISFSLADEYAKSTGPTKWQQLTKGDIAFSLRHIASNHHTPKQVAVGSNLGDVFILDLSKPSEQGHIISRQKGVQGAVRDMIFHPSKPNALVVLGLDRFVRTWDVSKSRSLGNLYTKLRQNSVCFTNLLAPLLKEQQRLDKAKRKAEEAKQKEEKKRRGSDDEDQSDDMEDDMEDDFSDISDEWEGLPVVEEKSKKRKRSSSESATPSKKSKK